MKGRGILESMILAGAIAISSIGCDYKPDAVQSLNDLQKENLSLYERCRRLATGYDSPVWIPLVHQEKEMLKELGFSGNLPYSHRILATPDNNGVWIDIYDHKGEFTDVKKYRIFVNQGKLKDYILDKEKALLSKN